MSSFPPPRPSSPERVSRPSGVGRLVPLEGVPVRPHPDRQLLMRFLEEVRLPIAALDTFVELVEMHDLAPAVREAIAAISDNTRYLGDLVGDFAEYSLLEADGVMPKPAATSAVTWLERVVQHHRERSGALGIDIEIVHRSFLPDAVELDAGLAAQALDAVLRTALYRARPGPLQLRVSYRGHSLPGMPKAEQLTLDVVTVGGGFTEMEQGYVFEAFHASDAMQRPLLGLSIAHRLARLLGGDLRIESPGPRACTYHLAIAATPTTTANWVDPMVGSQERLGAVWPGRLFFVESGIDNHLLCGAVLRRIGYDVDCLATTEGFVERVLATPDCTAVVIDAALLGSMGDAPAQLRRGGFSGSIVLFANDALAMEPPDGCDAVLQSPLPGAELAHELARQRDRRKASKLR